MGLVGHKGSTLQYRRILGLEQDLIHLAYIQRPLFNHRNLYSPWKGATEANGCIQIVSGTSKLGIINELHFVSVEDVEKYRLEEKAIFLEAEAGDQMIQLARYV